MLDSSTRFVPLPDLELTTGINIRRAFPRHIHDSVCIGLVERGARGLTTPDAETMIAPGEVFVLNPHQAHACQSVGAGASYRIVSLQPAVVGAFVTVPGTAPRLPVFPAIRIVDRPLAEAMRALCGLVDRAHDPLTREAALGRLLTRLIAIYSAAQPADLPTPGCAAIRRARDYIQACYAQKISLADLAGICQLSAYHLQRTFVACTGLSPHDYLIHVRIKHSKTLLRQGCPLAEVAQAVGFVDQSHFTRSFKAWVGLTPGYFAQQHH